jgi:hypothetical protein
MENFFYNENFYSDLSELMNDIGFMLLINFQNDEIAKSVLFSDSINELKDDWQIKVELADLEPIFEVDADTLCQLLADANEDRLTENFGEEQEVLSALKECIDFEKLKEKLPKLYYPNGKFVCISKKDLILNSQQ